MCWLELMALPGFMFLFTFMWRSGCFHEVEVTQKEPKVMYSVHFSQLSRKSIEAKKNCKKYFKNDLTAIMTILALIKLTFHWWQDMVQISSSRYYPQAAHNGESGRRYITSLLLEEGGPAHHRSELLQIWSPWRWSGSSQWIKSSRPNIFGILRQADETCILCRHCFDNGGSHRPRHKLAAITATVYIITHSQSFP